MLYITYRSLARGSRWKPPLWGYDINPVTAGKIGGSLRMRQVFCHFTAPVPERPVRAIPSNLKLPPILYNRMDHLISIDNALALSRMENQISVTLTQLALGIRNADVFVEKFLLNREQRPSLYTLWFHEQGLRNHLHILATLAPHHLVPLFSIISYDVEQEKMTVSEAKELFVEIIENVVATPPIVQREIYNQMVRVYCLNDDEDGALEMVEEMVLRRVRRTFVTYAPLFRLIRQKDDPAKYIALINYIKRVEGGAFGKFIFIDTPRNFYLFGVFIRYNWTVICCIITFIICTTFIVVIDPYLEDKSNLN